MLYKRDSSRLIHFIIYKIINTFMTKSRISIQLYMMSGKYIFKNDWISYLKGIHLTDDVHGHNKTSVIF
jgi:hypothetical protein